MIKLFFCVFGIAAIFVIGTILCVAFGLIDKLVARFGKTGKTYQFVTRNGHKIFMGIIVASLLLFIFVGTIATYDIVEANVKAYLPKWY